MNHLPVLPLLIPFLATLVLLVLPRIEMQRTIGLCACLLSLATCLWLTLQVDDDVIRVYALGNWSAPFGIVLVADRLSALMTLLSALLGTCCLIYACGGFDQRGRFFHALFQLQLLGLNGAFLTGDLFNLFVFFEIILLASYALLAQGGGLLRTRAGIAYVLLNLLGSSIFLIALGLLYGTLGTLNLADVAVRLAETQRNDVPLRLALALLVSVFLLKAALLPLSFWLPHTYSAAPAPVAALFAIMTKVGIVVLLRVQVVAIAPTHPELLYGWLTILALATLVFAVLGVLSAKNMKTLAAWLVLISAASLLLIPAQPHEAASAAGLYYLVHSTLAGAACFLLADMISRHRGLAKDTFVVSASPFSPILGLSFLVLSISLAGLPPFSGFIGKLMLLTSLRETGFATAIWVSILGSSFIVAICLARAGSTLLWEKTVVRPSSEAAAPTSNFSHHAATAFLILAGPLLFVLAKPLTSFVQRTATQLHTPANYIQAVLGSDPASIQRMRRE